VEAFLLKIGGYNTIFDNCCHGGTRKKATSWWSNVDWFTSLAAQCDDSHYHQKWNAEIVDGRVVFPTHLEAAYPVLLCERLATIAKLKALELGAFEIHDLAQQTEHAPSSQHRFLLDMLPKGRKFKPLFLNMDATKNGLQSLREIFLTNNFCTISPRVQKLCIDSCTRVFFGSMKMTRAVTVTLDVMPHVRWSILHTKF
jgi:hypothetical protein